MADKLTRRQMAAAIAGAVSAAIPATAQTAPVEAGDPLAAARKKIRESVAKMEEVDLPMSAEPAFIFKP